MRRLPDNQPRIRDKHKISRQVRRLKRETESCITLSAFRKFVREVCRVLSSPYRLGAQSSSSAPRRISATKGFLLNLRSLIVADAVQRCQRASVLLRSKTTLDDATIALADLEERAATDPAVHNLCEAVAGDSPETRDAAKARFYDLDWCTRSEATQAVRHDYSQAEYRLTKYRTKPAERQAGKQVVLDEDPFDGD